MKIKVRFSGDNFIPGLAHRFSRRFRRGDILGRGPGSPSVPRYIPAAECPSIREGRDDRTLSFGQDQARNEGHQCPAGSSKVRVRIVRAYAAVVKLIRH